MKFVLLFFSLFDRGTSNVICLGLALEYDSCLTSEGGTFLPLTTFFLGTEGSEIFVKTPPQVVLCC